VAKLTQAAKREAKAVFSAGFQKFIQKMRDHVSAEDGEWTVKGFIDIYRNIYTISSDTKIV
jgi:Leu/Phe-tRNA-protein transferase